MSKGFTNIKNVTIVNEVHNTINKGKKIVTEIKDIITLMISYFSIFGAVDLLQKKLINIITEKMILILLIGMQNRRMIQYKFM